MRAVVVRSTRSSDPVSTVEPEAVEALQDALAAEHAALWSYSLAVAFLPNRRAQQAREDADQHRELRAAIEQTLTDLGQRPVSALPAYATPKPVTDADTAAELLVIAETDALGAWRSVLEHTVDRPLRRAALEALTKATRRCAYWRRVVGSSPPIPTFPGHPDQL